MTAFPSLPEQLEEYAFRLGALRARAADPQRDAYGVALGQLLALDLIERRVYDEAMAAEQL